MLYLTLVEKDKNFIKYKIKFDYDMSDFTVQKKKKTFTMNMF